MSRSLRAQFLLYGALNVAASSLIALLAENWILPALVGPRPVLRDFIAFAYLLVLLLVPLWIFVGRAVLAPLRVLSEAMERAAPGAGGAVIPAEAFPRNELGRVMEGWNQTLRRLDEQSARLTASWGAVEEILRLMAAGQTPEGRILQVALEVLVRAVGARYGAMHVLDEHGKTVAFLHTGLTEEEQRHLAGREPPRGLGLLGALQEGQVIRLDDLTRDARYRGFPEGHPPMRSFLGVPIAAGGKVYGRIYLTEKAGGEPFTEADERLALTVTRSLALAVESMRVARRVHAVERLSRRILASLPDAVIVLGRGGEVRYANRVFYDWFGGEPSAVAGRSLREVLPLAEAARQVEEIVTGRSRPSLFEATWRPGEGEERTFRITVSGLRVAEEEEEEEEEEELVIFQELTAHRRMAEKQRALEEQLRQSQKMEAVGTLAGGIAHDFNNLMTVITGRAQLLMRHAGRDDTVRQDLSLIQQTAARAARLVKQLLAFSRRQVLEPKVLDLNSVVEGTRPMLERLLREDIELAAVLRPELWRVKVDPGQIEQVIVNLVVNARDAMPEGGRLTMETANAELDQEDESARAGVEPGEYVMLSVSDTGCGMDAETQSHMFEPFFTTKPPGEGTGLGLSTVDGIVRQSGGGISVESEPGRGTTFRIYLPRVDRPLDALGSAQPPVEALGGTETILLVEDDADVRTLIREVLQSHAYMVLEANDVSEALAISEHHPATIDVLVTDVVMPKMNGPALAERLMPARPGLKTLYISGYTGTVGHEGMLERGAGFLQKPFTPDALAAAVRRVLDYPGGRGTP